SVCSSFNIVAERSRVSRHNCVSSAMDWLNEGIISRSLLRYWAVLARSGKHRASRSTMIDTDVDAPGDAPRSADMVPSALLTTSVPNSSMPPCSSSFLMTCTRWPAISSSQSSLRAVGTYAFNAANRSSGLCRTWLIRYLVRGMLSIPAASIGRMLLSLIDAGRSNHEPLLRNLVEKPAYGPNSSAVFRSITRVSRWRTDMGGEPTAALPYTLAWCFAIITGLVHFNHWPLTENPPKPSASGMPDFSSSNNDPPPAPIKTNLA